MLIFLIIAELLVNNCLLWLVCGQFTTTIQPTSRAVPAKTVFSNEEFVLPHLVYELSVWFTTVRFRTFSYESGTFSLQICADVDATKTGSGFAFLRLTESCHAMSRPCTCRGEWLITKPGRKSDLVFFWCWKELNSFKHPLVHIDLTPWYGDKKTDNNDMLLLVINHFPWKKKKDLVQIQYLPHLRKRSKTITIFPCIFSHIPAEIECIY